MKKKLFNLPFIFILTTALFSCSNILDASLSNTNKSIASEYSITGYVSPYDFAETATSKSAFPTVPDSDTTLYYTVTATHGSTSVSENVQGTNGAQFNLKLPSTGDWSVTATCFGPDSSRATVVYKTVKPAVISISNASPSKFASLTLKPLMTSGKSGTLNLEIDGTPLAASFHPSQIQVECISGNLPDMDDRITYFFNIPTKKYTLKTKDGKALPSGSYTFNINFITPSRNLYFYSVTETVNIYDGLETNRWVKNGNEEYITSDGKFELTDAIVNKFQQESIYVDSEALSDNASGTWLDPYKSLDAAIARLGTGSSVKTIFVSGNHTTSKNLNFSDGGNCNHDFTIKKNPRASTKPEIKTTTTSSFIVGGPYKIVIENIDFTGCGNDDGASPTGTNSDPTTKAGAFLYFPSSTGSTEITNCTISDYYSHKGGAISAGANSTTTLTNVDITRCKATKGGAIAVHGNVTYVSGNITDCWADNNGGAIYHENGNLTIEEGVCIGKRNATAIADITNLDEHKYSNYAYNYGGGIYSEGGTLSLKGLISYNAVTNNGGGLYLGKTGLSLTYNPTDELEVSYNYAGTTGGGILYTERKSSSTYNIRGKIHHNQAKTGGGLCISPQTKGNTFNIFSPVYNNKAYAETTDDDSSGSGGGISILSSIESTSINIKSDITQNTASNLGGGIFVAGTADTEVNISGILSGNAVSGSNPILSHGIYVRRGKLCLNSDSEISSGQDMYVYDSTSRIKIQDTPSKLGNIKLYLNTNPEADDSGIFGFKSGGEIFTGTTEEILKAGLLKITPADVDNYEFIKNVTSGYLSRKVYIAGSDSIKLPHGENQASSENPDRGKKTAPFASLSYASRWFNHNDFITYYIEGTTVEGSTTAEENPCIFMDNIVSPKTITVRGYEGGKRATLTGMLNNNEFDEKYSTFFYNVAGKLTISDIDIDGTGSKYSSAVITGDPLLFSTPVTDIYDVNIKNFNFVASGTDPETGTILCNSDFAVINIKGGSIKDCNRIGGAIFARVGNVHISLHEISGCTNTKTGEDAVVTSGGDTWRAYLHLEDTSISGTDSTKAVVKIYDSPSNAGAIKVGGDTTIENGYVYLVNKANITLTSNITSDICAHIKSSDPNTYATVLKVDTEGHSLDEQKEILTNSYTKFIYDGTYELQPVFADTYYANLYAVSYVDGSNGKTKAAGGNGSKDNPFKTVSEAVDELRTQLNSVSNKNAIVYVAGTTAESDSIKPQLSSNTYLTTLSIKQWPGKTEAVIKRGTVENSIIIVGTNSTITIEDIDIDGNNVVLTDINGAGLSIQGGSATLNNVKIYGCKVKQVTTPPDAGFNYGQGGAIFVKGSPSKLYLNGNTVIGSDVSGTLTESNSSNCAQEGGAIFFQTVSSSSALEIEDTVVIKGNYADSNGGAIYMRQQNLSANIGGSIRNNTAGTAGGAIYNYGCTSVINGTISGNTSPSGSIYAVVSGQIKLNSKSNIGSNDEVVLGCLKDADGTKFQGDIYLDERLPVVIKVRCEDPDTTTQYGKAYNAARFNSYSSMLVYNGPFEFDVTLSNFGKLKVAPIYVAGSGSGMTGSDSNPGTETQPLATVASAVNKIKDFGGTIYVAGTTTETTTIETASTGSLTYTISQWAGKPQATISRATTFNDGCMLNITSGKTVTVTNVDFDGNNVATTLTGENSSINNHGTLTFNTVNIKNMLTRSDSTDSQGAICNYSTLTYNGGSITNCKVENASGVPTGLGGAIYNVLNTSELINVTISGCKADTGSSIFVELGSIIVKGSTEIVDSASGIYLADDSARVIIDGTLTATRVSNITVSPFFSAGTEVLTYKTDPSDLEDNWQKFTLNKTGYELWEDGKMTPVVALNSSDALGQLSSAYTAGVTTVIGRVSGTLNTSGNISVGSGKTLILQRAATATTAAIKFSDDDPAVSMFNVNRGKLVVTDIVLDGNDKDVSLAGSCIYATGGSTVTLNGATQIKDFYSLPYSARTGGAVFSDTGCTLNISDAVIISNNTTGIDFEMQKYAAMGPAGGAICSKGTLNISGNVKITENNLAWNERDNLIPGGAIFAGGTTSITGNVEISSNNIMLITSNMYAYGAGIYVDGSLTINGNNVKICDNQSSKFRPEQTSCISKGAGIYVAEGATLSLQGNITISGNNNAVDTTEGPAIYSKEHIDTSNILYVEGTGGVRVFGNKNNDDVVTGEEQITITM